MPLARPIVRDGGAHCDVSRQVFGLGGVEWMKTSRCKQQCLHIAFIPPVLTAARQLQLFTGFPINSERPERACYLHPKIDVQTANYAIGKMRIAGHQANIP